MLALARGRCQSSVWPISGGQIHACYHTGGLKQGQMVEVVWTQTIPLMLVLADEFRHRNVPAGKHSPNLLSPLFLVEPSWYRRVFFLTGCGILGTSV